MRRLMMILTLVLPLIAQGQQQPAECRRSLKLMGSAFVITALSTEVTEAYVAIDSAIAEIQRIESLISSWDPMSQTSLINANAGNQPVKVSKELYDLVVRAKKISELTDGAFDISFSSITPVWHFDGRMTELPNENAIAASIKLINYKHIILNEKDTTVYLKKDGMRIGFGAMGKGYAANRAAALMQRMGINAGVVNAGGDIYCWGDEGNGEPWQILIAHPEDKAKIAAKLNITDMAVVTSGNYEKFIEVGGKRYSHIIDPLTGWPAQGLTSVTIICPDAELADALATSVFVLGVDDGMYFVEQLQGIECVLIDDSGAVHTSSGIDQHLQTQKEQE